MEADPITLTYKQVQGVSLNADVYVPPEDGARKLRPTIVHFHAGGLTSGNKQSWLPIWLIKAAHELGWIFITVDYRLLLPITGHEILEDIKDFFQFLRQRQLRHEHRPNAESPDGPQRDLEVDPTRLIVSGASAGGYLAYLAGLWCDPKPKAVVSLCGMGGNYLTNYLLVKKTQPFFFDRPLLDPTLPELIALLSPTTPPPVTGGVERRTDSEGRPLEPRMMLSQLLFQEATFLDHLTGDRTLSSKLAAALKETKDGDISGMVDMIPKEHRALLPAVTHQRRISADVATSRIWG